MERASALLALCACGELTGHRQIPAQRPVTRIFDIFFDLRLNKRLSKQSWSWWFETPWCTLWRHCNVDWVVLYTWKLLPEYDIWLSTVQMIIHFSCLNSSEQCFKIVRLLSERKMCHYTGDISQCVCLRRKYIWLQLLCSLLLRFK